MLSRRELLKTAPAGLMVVGGGSLLLPRKAAAHDKGEPTLEVGTTDLEEKALTDSLLIDGTVFVKTWKHGGDKLAAEIYRGSDASGDVIARGLEGNNHIDTWFNGAHVGFNFHNLENRRLSETRYPELTPASIRIPNLEADGDIIQTRGAQTRLFRHRETGVEYFIADFYRPGIGWRRIDYPVTDPNVNSIGFIITNMITTRGFMTRATATLASSLSVWAATMAYTAGSMAPIAGPGMVASACLFGAYRLYLARNFAAQVRRLETIFVNSPTLSYDPANPPDLSE